MMTPHDPPKESTVNLLTGRDSRELVLTFAGNIVKHLGVQMYAGRPVPAIAELISNAWDADAKRVEVVMPLDKPWSPSVTGQVIEVQDDGNGMNWDMIRDAYLDVGRDRREDEKTDKSPSGRPVQGRKGVGKLAGFGIADLMEVQTIHKEADPKTGAKALIWFRLSLLDLKKAGRNPAPVELIYAGPVGKAPKGARKKRGTTIILRHLHERRAQAKARFRQSMAERFLMIGPKFCVRINKKELKEDEIELQWRWPAKKGWTTVEVPGCGNVSYWLGFTEQPRKQNEGDLSGILIYTRGKISQEATLFNISGGVTGQHGLRYLVGMIKAEWLDGDEAPDLIATHRGTIAWESVQGRAFQEWGQALVKRYLAEWARLRMNLREKQIKEMSPQTTARLSRLSPSYRQVAIQFLDKFKAIEMEPEDFEDILSWFLDALENATLRSILQKLKEAKTTDLVELDDLLSKMEVRTAVTLLQIIESNLAAIDTLEKMHRQNAKERGVLSKHLEANPWLIDTSWMLNKPEARVCTWIRNEFKLDKKKMKKAKGDDDRVDFFCVAVGGSLHIVEIKRGGHVATDKDILQANRYREYVLKRFDELTEAKAIKYSHVQSHLIAADLSADARTLKKTYADNGYVFFTTWDDLIERAKVSHHQFKEILEKRAAESGDAVAENAKE